MSPQSLRCIALAIFASVHAATALAQCALDDEFEPNDDCASATPLHTSATDMLRIHATDPDLYWIDVPGGESCELFVQFPHAGANIDVRVTLGCSGATLLVASGTSLTDDEFVTWTNPSASTQRYHIRVFTTTPNICIGYSMVCEIPLCPVDDQHEDTTDTCNVIFPGVPVLDAGTYNSLVSTTGDDDYFRVFVPAGAHARVDVWFEHGGANGNIDAQVSSVCGGPVLDAANSTSSNEVLAWSNSTAFDRNDIVRIHQAAGSAACAEYALTIEVGCSDADEDDLEENDTCQTAVPVAANSVLANRRVRGLDPDWYEIVVPSSATLRARALFSHDDADVDLRLQRSCSQTVASSSTMTDDEELAWTNQDAAAQVVSLQVRIAFSEPSSCAAYDLELSLEGGGPENVVPYCFGDGSGTPCPCNNDSTAGHPGGCAHQDGDGAILFAGGTPSASLGGGPQFDLIGASASTFSLLVSGDNALPQLGPCVGCGLQAFDGLRCAGGNFVRHGARAVNALGNTTTGWGPPYPPANGVANEAGFVSGQTRFFSAFFRTDVAQTCGSGQNASNGIGITFGP